MPETTGPTAGDLRARYGQRYRWYVLATVMVGLIASIISSTIVNVAVPDMSRYFSLGQERAQWISAAFMVATTLAMPLTPALLERFGLRRTFFSGLIMLSLGGIAGGLSSNFELMIAARVVEGFSAGLLQPIPSIVILRAFSSNEQGRAMGIFGMGVVLAPAMGPTVGGMLVEAFGWRSIFFFVVPPCLLALWLGRRFLSTVSSFAPAQGRFDWVGLSALSTAVLLVLNGLVSLSQGLISAGSLLLPGLLLMAGFVWLQMRNPHPLLALKLLRDPAFGLGVLVAFIYGLGLFGSTYLLPVYLQMGLGYAPSAAGAALFPGGVTLAITLYFAGRLADRMPPSRLVLAGAIVFASSLALMSTVGPNTPYWLMICWVIVGRVGLGLILPSLTLAVTRGLARDDMAQAASLNALLRQFGGAVGVSAVGLLLEWRLRAWGFSVLELGALRDAPPAHLSEPFRETFRLLALMTAPAVIGAWLMTRASRQPTSSGPDQDS